MIGIGSKTSKGKMIMKKTLYFAVSAALALAACAKEEAPVENEPTFQNLNTIYASVPETKTTESAAEFSWTDSEAIAVGGVLSESTQFYNYTCSNTSTGAFSGSATDSRKVAVSPSSAASAFTTGGDTFSYSLSMGTEYGSYIPGTTNALMVGEPVESNKYRFNHAAALLKVTYENAPVGTTGLKFTSKNHKITGMKSGIATASGVELTLADFASTGGNDVTITLSSPLDATANLIFYIPIPSGDYTSFEFNVNLTGSDAIASSTAKTVKGTTTIARGDVLSLPAITLSANFTPIIVNGNDANWWSVFGSNFPVAKGEILHLEFTNNQGSAHNRYNNWNIALSNVGVGNANYQEFFVLRSDNYGWGNIDYDASRVSLKMNDVTVNLDDIDQLTSFNNKMNGANVNMTIEHTNAGSIILTAKSISSDNTTTIIEKYSQKVPYQMTVYATLVCDHSSFDMKKAWYSKSSKTISSLSLSRNTTYYVFDKELNMQYVGSDVLATYNTGDIAPVDPAAISFTNISVPSSSPENQNITASADGTNSILPITVNKGTADCGAVDFSHGWKTDYYPTTHEQIASGNNLSKTLHLYSKSEGNWQAPYVELTKGNGTVYALLRIDNFTSEGTTTSSTPTLWNWVYYANNLHRANITLSIENTGNVATVTYNVTGRDGLNYPSGQVYTVAVDSNDLYYRFMTDGCYVVFHD